MRNILPFVLLSFTVHSLFGQQDSLLQNFKFRIDHYRAVSIDINGGASKGDAELAGGTNRSTSASANMGLSYFFTRSTDKRSMGVWAGINSGFNSEVYHSRPYKNKTRGFSPSAYFNISNRWFRENFFMELNADLSAYYHSNNVDEQNPLLAATYKQNFQSVAAQLGMGKGRLENITDMQNALRLYEALTGEKQLSRSLTPAELDELGRTITTANNTRILDQRKRTRFILETVDHYLQSKGMISLTDIHYFSNLNDILFFAFNNNRMAGSEKYIRLTPAISHAGNDATDKIQITKTENRITTKAVRLSIGYNQYHPVNLRHQNDYGIAAFANYISQPSADRYFVSGILSSFADLRPEIKQAGLDLFYRHSIYPDTRTVIVLDLRAEPGYEDNGPDSDFFANVTCLGSFNYFISYRTRLTASIGGEYQKHYYQVYQSLQLLPDNWRIFANAGIQVSL